MFKTFTAAAALLIAAGAVQAANDPKDAIAALDARLAKIGAPKLEGTEKVADKDVPALYFGERKINNNYDVVDAVRKIVEAGVPANKINEKMISAHMYDPTMPDPELVVRTSGEIRTSNYLMWESAYSEWVFTDVLWPDFRRENLYDSIREYQQRERRFGGLAPRHVGADGVAGVVIDQLQDHACATTGEYVLGAVQLPARIRSRIHEPAPR